MPKTLLLADDSVTIQKVVGITFANEDVELVTVDNGDDALARARVLKPDIVLADVSMPGLDGYALCSALKAEPELSHIPVLLLAGTFDNFNEARAAEAQVDAHIAKPFEAQALVDQVHRLLERAAGPAAPAATPAEVSHEAEASAPSDFGFDDLDFEAPAAEAPLDQTWVFGQDPPEEKSGFATGPTAPMPPNPADELTRVEGTPWPVEAAAADTKPDDAAAVEDVLFSDSSVLEPLDEHVEEVADAAPSDADSLDADPFSVDPSGEFEVPSDPLEGGPDPLGDSGALGDPSLSDSAPLLPLPEEQSMAQDGETTPMAQERSEPPLVEEPMAWAEPVSPDGNEAAVEEPWPEPGEPEAVLEPAMEEAEAPPLASERPPASLDAELVHEVLEKLAWEAFGPLSEQIVREVLQKVEAIAWEVVPQLAERLIEAEIKRMKAHSSE
jgi:CheY-like chemotaxis protein